MRLVLLVFSGAGSACAVITAHPPGIAPAIIKSDNIIDRTPRNRNLFDVLFRFMNSPLLFVYCIYRYMKFKNYPRDLKKEFFLEIIRITTIVTTGIRQPIAMAMGLS